MKNKTNMTLRIVENDKMVYVECNGDMDKGYIKAELSKTGKTIEEVRKELQQYIKNVKLNFPQYKILTDIKDVNYGIKF